MKKIKAWLLFIPKEIIKFVTYYPCTYISRYIDYFHYKLLTCIEFPIFTINPASGVIGNKCYGNLWAVRNACGHEFHSNCMIEHGLYFGEFVIETECLDNSINTIYTFSEYRKNAILKWFKGKLDKNIITVGPYILYANHFKSEIELASIKKKMGKVLLVFPSHSSPGEVTEYNLAEFLKEVDRVAQYFDSVLVSLYWLDVRRKYDKPYIKRGYKVVCSGIRSDRWFLSRQKDLFWLADVSMSNDIGTHIGYSIAMGVPHYLYKQKIKLISNAAEYSFDKCNQNRLREYNEMIESFGSLSFSITDEQISVVKKYWGQW